jgi:hypothetical protein
VEAVIQVEVKEEIAKSYREGDKAQWSIGEVIKLEGFWRCQCW